MKRLPLLLLLSPLPYACAQEGAPARVEVQGKAQPLEAAVASKVVGRAEIAAYGDGNLADVLKRQSGIAVVGSEVRMRGLGTGYTQMLVDGEPVPQGFTIDTIAPELVERIEIARTPTADRSAQAVAGTINIVLRKRSNTGRREDKVSTGYQRGEWSPSASTQLSGKRGDLAWSLGASAERTVRIDRVLTDETIEEAGSTTAARRFTESGLGRTGRLNLAPRLNWTFENGDTLGWNTLVGLVRSQSDTAADEETLLGAPTDYPASTAAIGSHTASLRSDLAWAHRFQGAGKLTVKGVVDASRRRGDYLFLGTRPDGSLGLARAVASGADERTASLNGKYLAPLGAAHSLGLGWDASRTTRGEHRNQFDTIDGIPNAAQRLQDYTARVERLALFAQDEWTISERFEGYAGLRWEGLRTGTDGADLARVATSSSVASPILQLLWKLPAKQQLRLALARTYKAPLTGNLVPRRYTINNNNGPANPDVEGNPDLRPELSWGLDLAYERPLGEKGTATLSGYAKRVSDVTTQQLYRDGLSWVARPINNGDADLAGVEVDLKSPLKVGAAAFELRLNAGRNWSRVRNVPGPDNTLAEQVPFTLNLGADYRGVGIWSAGANLNIRASATSRSIDGVTTWLGRTAPLDLYWTRKLDAGWRLRASVANALGSKQRAGTIYRDADGTIVTRAQAWGGMASLRVGFERAL
ncbi:TonB-dependent siderophore receptor [Massilia sp. Mn16-1_5]|uniref:TonB-dependent receptor plug domain-containing protein n=1 Tax=Massilia sp. Mn16-1_5 TaxID=2079199 RepID=UPI00109E4F46|nr:TonB-dependent receptor [Massilia sp. Mn16-1_5]THC41588.1 TonB-dependent receptor [Massilia sp. Mn16-1_5]